MPGRDHRRRGRRDDLDADSATAQPAIRVGGALVDWTRFTVYGVDAARFTVDLPAGDTALTVEPGP